MVEGRIKNNATDKCDKCKKLFKTGDEIKLSISHKDVLGWAAKTIYHKECP